MQIRNVGLPATSRCEFLSRDDLPGKSWLSLLDHFQRNLDVGAWPFVASASLRPATRRPSRRWLAPT
jgi:hypothetical protein